jgi:hypothetical protein
VCIICRVCHKTGFFFLKPQNPAISHFQNVIPMKGKSPDSSQISFLMSGLSEQLNPRHSIYQLSKIIDWPSFENDFTRLHSRNGRPAKPVHLMISLLLLKQLYDLSDDQVVDAGLKTPTGNFSAESTNSSGLRRLPHQISPIFASVLVKRAPRVS